MPTGRTASCSSLLAAALTPIAPDRVALQLTVSQGTADKLQYARELLGFQIQHGDISEGLDRALDALITQLEKEKFAATGNPRASRRRTSPSERYVPSSVKRQVWKRDQGRCVFVSDSGHRCASREDLQFDHVEAVARGGRATISNVRLLSPRPASARLARRGVPSARA